MLDGHGAVRVPTDVYGRLTKRKKQRHHSRQIDRISPVAWRGMGSKVNSSCIWKVSGVYLWHHRDERVRGGWYPLLQERLQDRVSKTDRARDVALLLPNGGRVSRVTG